eukprot:scaffold364165_cov40-Prasinocladus_malaysianus.AAC.2
MAPTRTSDEPKCVVDAVREGLAMSWQLLVPAANLTVCLAVPPAASGSGGFAETASLWLRTDRLRVWQPEDVDGGSGLGVAAVRVDAGACEHNQPESFAPKSPSSTSPTSSAVTLIRPTYSAGPLCKYAAEDAERGRATTVRRQVLCETVDAVVDQQQLSALAACAVAFASGCLMPDTPAYPSPSKQQNRRFLKDHDAQAANNPIMSSLEIGVGCAQVSVEVPGGLNRDVGVASFGPDLLAAQLDGLRYTTTSNSATGSTDITCELRDAMVSLEPPKERVAAGRRVLLGAARSPTTTTDDLQQRQHRQQQGQTPLLTLSVAVSRKVASLGEQGLRRRLGLVVSEVVRVDVDSQAMAAVLGLVGQLALVPRWAAVIQATRHQNRAYNTMSQTPPSIFAERRNTERRAERAAVSGKAMLKGLEIH